MGFMANIWNMFHQQGIKFMAKFMAIVKVHEADRFTLPTIQELFMARPHMCAGNIDFVPHRYFLSDNYWHTRNSQNII